MGEGWNHGETLSLFLGYSFKRGNPKPWDYFKVPNVMINAYDVMTRCHSIRPAHKLLSYGGYICCDSGGWQILQGKNVSIHDIINAQRKLKPDLSVMLDNNLDEKKHLKNLRIYLEEADFDFFPVISYNISGKTLRKVSELIDNPPLIGIGGLVPVIGSPIDVPELGKVVETIKRARETFPSTKIHLFGIGGWYTALALFLLVDSIDTSSWVHDARFGKIRVLGGGVYGTHPMENNPHINERWYDCPCSVCKKHSIEELDQRNIDGFRLRATHNAWVLLKEVEIAKRMFQEGNYLRYVKGRIKGKPKHLLEKILEVDEGTICQS